MKDPFHLKLKIDLLLYFFPSHRFQIIRFLCNQFGLVVSIACKYSPWCYGSPSRDARATRKWMKTPVEAAKMPCIRSRHGQTRPCRWHNPVSLSSWYTSREKPRSKGVTSGEGESIYNNGMFTLLRWHAPSPSNLYEMILPIKCLVIDRPTILFNRTN